MRASEYYSIISDHLIPDKILHFHRIKSQYTRNKTDTHHLAGVQLVLKPFGISSPKTEKISKAKKFCETERTWDNSAKASGDFASSCSKAPQQKFPQKDYLIHQNSKRQSENNENQDFLIKQQANHFNLKVKVLKKSQKCIENRKSQLKSFESIKSFYSFHNSYVVCYNCLIFHVQDPQKVHYCSPPTNFLAFRAKILKLQTLIQKISERNRLVKENSQQTKKYRALNELLKQAFERNDYRVKPISDFIEKNGFRGKPLESADLTKLIGLLFSGAKAEIKQKTFKRSNSSWKCCC